jgi:hypothetical protein
MRVLSIWGHGEGWRTVENHDFSHGSSVNYLDWAPLLKDARLDLVIFDTCSMATLETLNAYAGVVPAVLATQFEMPIEGIDYSGLASFSGETAVELSRGLRADTLRSQRATSGWYAPLVLYRLEGFEEFRSIFNRILSESWAAMGAPADLPSRARPSCCGAPGVDDAVDLRAYSHRVVERLDGAPTAKKWPAEQARLWKEELLEAYTRLLSDRGYGSLQFFLPEIVTEDLKQPASKAWTGNLSNWDLVREHLIQKGNVR